MGIGKEIKCLLDEKQRSVSWLSRETGITDNTLYAMIKRDSNNIAPNNLFRITQALNTTTPEIVKAAYNRAMRLRGHILDNPSDYEYDYDSLLEANAKDLEELKSLMSAFDYGFRDTTTPYTINVGDLSDEEVKQMELFKEFLLYKRRTDGNKE